jgi:hypothetical protein|tara:strand:+ start:263 stop:484 length:222 start_codon:yes stop_codon:yes gene_type:complete
MNTFEVTIKAHLTRPGNESLDTSEYNKYEIVREMLSACEANTELVEVTAIKLEPSRNPVRQAPQPVNTGRSGV